MGYLLTTKFFKKYANYCGDKSHAFVNSMIKVLENIIIMFCSNLSSNLIVYACFFYHKYVIIFEGQCRCFSSYIGVDCSQTKSTPPTNATLPESGLCRTSKRACVKTNIFGYFQSEIVYVKLEEFEVMQTNGVILTEWWSFDILIHFL